jgi:hypothetical protein
MEQPSTASCNSPQPPPIFRLPPELIIRILGFVALLGSPADLSRLNRTCKAFHYHLSDPSRALDRTIWQPAASSILGLCTPVQTPLDPTWQAFVKRVWGLRNPSSIVPPGLEEEEQAREERRIRSLQEDEFVHTTYSGPFAPPPVELSHREGGYEHHVKDAVNASLPPVPMGARRVLDFLHTGTEGIRGGDMGVAYCGSNGAFFVFADDPKGWRDIMVSAAKGELRRGFVEVGGGVEVDGDLEVGGVEGVVEGVRDLSEWTVESGLDEVRKGGGRKGFEEWVRSTIHSDADLNIIPAMVKGGLVLKKVVRYKMPGVVDKTWHLEGAKCWKDLGEGPWLDTGPHWEFRSAGDHLIVCNDNSGSCESSIVCFSTASAPEPLWVKKMIGTTDAGEEYFYDNDGIKMNSAVVAYASRTQVFKGHPAQDLSMMKIFLLSTATGGNVRTLLLPQESRVLRISPNQMDLNSWCSISLSESFVVASVGGDSFVENGVRSDYNYREVFIWDLTNKSQDSPTHAIRLPEYAQTAREVFTVLSQDGRFLGLHARWRMEVWDLKKRARVGVWKVRRGYLYDEEGGWQPMDMNTGWNGLWIKWRDVYDVPPQTTSSTESSAASQPERANQHPEPEKPEESQATKQKQEERSGTPGHDGDFSLLPPSSTRLPLETHGMQYLTSRTLRRIFSRLIPNPLPHVEDDLFSEDSSDDDSYFGALSDPFEDDDSRDSDFEPDDEIWDEVDDYDDYGGDYEGDVGDNVGLGDMVELAELMMGEFSHSGGWGAFGYLPATSTTAATASPEHGAEEGGGEGDGDGDGDGEGEGEGEGDGEEYKLSDTESGGAEVGDWGDAMHGSPLPDWVPSAGYTMDPEDTYED